MPRNDLICGVAKIALCEFAEPFRKPMVQAAIRHLEEALLGLAPKEPDTVVAGDYVCAPAHLNSSAWRA